MALLVVHGFATYSAWVLGTRWWSLPALAACSAIPIGAVAIVWDTARRMNRMDGSPLYQLFIKSGSLPPSEFGSKIGLLLGVMGVSLGALLGIVPLVGAALLTFRR